MTRARDTADIVEDVSVDLALKSDYSLPVNTQAGTTYTFVLADDARLTAATNSSAKTFTIPPQSSVAWTANDIIRVVNYGAGALTIAGGLGVTVTNTATTIAQYQSAAVIRTGSDAWTLVPFSGGVSSADFSNTPTGTYTGYKYITFNSTGTLNITKAGLADVLLVGAGGGGASTGRRNGGGGGGQHVSLSGVYFGIGSYTVTIPGGGAAATPGLSSSINGISAAGGGAGKDGAVRGDGANGGGGQSDLGAGGVSNITGGFNGGSGLGTNYYGGGGGGGAGGNGANGQYPPSFPTGYSGGPGGAGGSGVASSITGTSVFRAGGGGGASGSPYAGGAGTHGGGNGGGSAGGVGVAGTANTGGGGGGGNATTGGSGGSGVVIVRVTA